MTQIQPNYYWNNQGSVYFDSVHDVIFLTLLDTTLTPPHHAIYHV